MVTIFQFSHFFDVYDKTSTKWVLNFFAIQSVRAVKVRLTAISPKVGLADVASAYGLLVDAERPGCITALNVATRKRWR